MHTGKKASCYDGGYLSPQVGWQDLAFFDPVSYESLRKLILTSREGKELRNLGVTFCVTLCPEEGGESVELVPGGSSVAVTAENVYEYVRKYAQLRMIHINEEPLRVSAYMFHLGPSGNSALLKQDGYTSCILLLIVEVH